MITCIVCGAHVRADVPEPTCEDCGHTLRVEGDRVTVASPKHRVHASVALHDLWSLISDVARLARLYPDPAPVAEAVRHLLAAAEALRRLEP